MESRKLSRRQLLVGGSALAGGALFYSPGAAGQTLMQLASADGSRPIITHGVQTGDVVDNRAVVWSRADRPSRMWVEVSKTPDFADSYKLRGPIARPEADYTTQVRLSGLRPGERMYYKVDYVDLDNRMRSEPVTGSFPTVADRGQDVRFAWVGDCAGQGWGINPEFGGMIGWETMRTFNPDFLIFSGDTVYADNPLKEEVELPDGSMWKNIVTPEKVKVAETLDEFRGQWKYNLLDHNVRNFNAEVPIIAQWDDHEVTNNWYPGEILEDDRYVVKDVDTLAARAAQAFHEYMPIGPSREKVGRVYRKISYGPLLDVFVLDMRTFKGPNDANLQTNPNDVEFMGQAQINWLVNAMKNSRAAWKVVAADMPIGLNVGDGANWEAIANGDDGVQAGREHEIAQLLGRLKRGGVEDVVWLTADVHYCAAHHYHPDRAQFKDFNPFWEFVSGPIHAGTFGPNSKDLTFGIEVDFEEAALYPNMAPSEGRQYFGVVDINAESKEMTVKLVNLFGDVLYEKVLAKTGR
jgi:alkaline phosphatase D